VTALAFDATGERVVVGSQAGLEVRDWPTLDVVGRLETELAHVNDLAFSPDGRTLAAAGGAPAEDGVWELFTWPSGELVRRQRGHDDLVYDVAWRDDGASFASAAADRMARVWRVGEEDALVELAGHSRGVTSVTWLPGAEVIVTAGLDHSLRAWEAGTGNLTRSLDNHTEPVLGLAVRPENGGGLPLLASISADRTLRLWQPTIGRLVRFARLSAEPLAVAWTHDGRLLIVSCTDGQVRVIDPDTVRIIAELPAIDGWAHCLAVAPGDDAVLVGGTGGQLRVLKIREANE